MPPAVVSATPSVDWVANFRQAIKVQIGAGGLVMPDYGRMRLQVRRPGVKTQSINLPYSWEEAHWLDAVARIKVISKAFNQGGLDLAGAAKVATATRSDHDTDWDAAITAYREGLKKRIAETTWKAKYTPVLTAALTALRSRSAPTNGADLCDAPSISGSQGNASARSCGRTSAASSASALSVASSKPAGCPPPVSTVRRSTRSVSVTR